MGGKKTNIGLKIQNAENASTERTLNVDNTPHDTKIPQNIKQVPKKLIIPIAFSIVALIAVGIGIFIYVNNKTPGNTDKSLQPDQAATSAITNTPVQEVKFAGRYIDIHAHINTSGMSISEIIKNMDTEGIDKMVIMKPPASVPVDTPQSDFAIPDAASQYPNRFAVLYGGEAIAMLERAATSGKYSQAEEDQFISLLEKEMKSGTYCGIGEIGLRHYVPTSGKSNVAYDLTIPGNHPWMFIMSDIAAKYNMPIDVHMEATAETIKGLEKLLDHNVNTKIIWDHTGWSHTVNKTAYYSEMATAELMGQLMEKHPNLYSSIKMRKENQNSPIYIFNSNSEIKPEWLAIFTKYPDRFMMGSDIKPGIDQEQFPIIKDHRKFLSQLPSEILKKIERENAEKIFKL
ncbi:MAG: TatD family hydrolase [bacterium]